MGMVLEGLPDRPLDLAQCSLSGRRRLGQRLCERLDHEAVRLSESSKDPASQLVQTTPPAAPEKPAEVLGLTAARAGGQLRREAGDEGELETKGQGGTRSPATRSWAGSIEQGQIAAEQVVGGRVGLG